jgi:hypothetical protein
LKLTVPRGTAARVLDISVRTFERLEASGALKPSVPGKRGAAARYDLLELVPAFLRHLRQQQPESPRDRRDNSQAALNELRLKKETAELIPRAAAERAGQTVVRTASALLQRLAYDLRRAGLVDDDGEELVEQAVRAMLVELSGLKEIGATKETMNEEDPPAA